MIKSVGLRVKFENEYYKIFPQRDPTLQVKTRSLLWKKMMSKKNDSSSRSKVGLTSAIDKSQSNEANEDNITVSIGSPVVQEKSKIYGRDRKDVTLNDWQIAVNQAAYELCQKDIGYCPYVQQTSIENRS